MRTGPSPSARPRKTPSSWSASAASPWSSGGWLDTECPKLLFRCLPQDVTPSDLGALIFYFPLKLIYLHSFIHSFIHSVPLILIHWLCRLIVGFLIDLLRPRIFLVVTLTNLVYALASANSGFLPTFRSVGYMAR